MEWLYDSARKLLDARKTVELELGAIRRQRDRSMSDGSPKGYGVGKCYPTAKGQRYVPDYMKDRVDVGRGTNNVGGMQGQHYDGYNGALERQEQASVDIKHQADELILLHPNGMARAILRDYYCNAMSDAAIAEVMDKDRRTICSMRNAAIENLEEFYFPKHSNLLQNTP
ncbi:hypothetical protein ACH6CV_14520 [Bacillota bacterium Meth-B3]